MLVTISAIAGILTIWAIVGSIMRLDRQISDLRTRIMSKDKIDGRFAIVDGMISELRREIIQRPKAGDRPRSYIGEEGGRFIVETPVELEALADEVKAWMEKNAIQAEATTFSGSKGSGCRFAFDNEADAVAFKARWS